MSAFEKLAVLAVGGPIAVVVLGIGGCEAIKAYYDCLLWGGTGNETGGEFVCSA